MASIQSMLRGLQQEQASGVLGGAGSAASSPAPPLTLRPVSDERPTPTTTTTATMAAPVAAASGSEDRMIPKAPEGTCAPHGSRRRGCSLMKIVWFSCQTDQRTPTNFSK